MTDKIIEIINALPREEKSLGRPCNPALIREIEEAYNLQLPEDYKAFLLTFNAGTITGKKRVIRIMEAEMVLGYNEDERFEPIPGMFAIGTDGGGALYFYDTRNIFEFGLNHIFLVHLGSLNMTDSRHIAASLTQTVEQILKGEDFFDRPTFGESKK